MATCQCLEEQRMLQFRAENPGAMLMGNREATTPVGYHPNKIRFSVEAVSKCYTHL